MCFFSYCFFFFFKQKTAYEMRISDWSSDVCSSDLRSPGAMTACSAIHINIFGPHPIVVFGSDEQKSRWVPNLVQGRVKSCFGVTEPDAGLNTTRIKTRAEKSGNG